MSVRSACLNILVEIGGHGQPGPAAYFISVQKSIAIKAEVEVSASDTCTREMCIRYTVYLLQCVEYRLHRRRFQQLFESMGPRIGFLGSNGEI